MTLVSPSDVVAVSKRDAGGDNVVPRDHMDRPRILLPCPACDGSGRIPSEKKPPPATIKCPKKCGPSVADEWIPPGMVAVAHTRVTTFIDVLDDKSNLMAWKGRMVLIGVATDTGLLDGVLEQDPEEKEGKDFLNRKAEVAAKLAGSEAKADKGTHLHGLSELVDEGKPLPSDISFEDVLDMDSYRRQTVGLKIRHMERLVVNTQYKVAGTPDRVSEWVGDEPLIAPNGYVFEPGAGELIITDLKTGSVEYGALKMAMQLSIYANSNLYDHKDGAQTPFENINREWGIIMHTPAGSGETHLYWADLTLGWEAVAVAKTVRDLRNRGRKALSPLVRQNTVPQFASLG